MITSHVDSSVQKVTVYANDDVAAAFILQVRRISFGRENPPILISQIIWKVEWIETNKTNLITVSIRTIGAAKLQTISMYY